MRAAASRRGLAATLVLALAQGCAFSRYLRGAPFVDPAPAQTIDFTLLLVGDAGRARSGDPVLVAMTAAAAAAPDKSAMVFLGDNLYPAGLVAEGNGDRARGEGVLAAQLSAARRAGVRGIFVPGNHDWDSGGDRGWDRVRREGRFIEEQGAELLPGGGCPGPSIVDFGGTVRLIAIDTQWWLHDGPKPLHPTSDCGADSETEILDSLTAALAGAGGRRVVLAAHHPLASTGKHGGYYNFKAHVFPLTEVVSWLWLPLPIVGSAYPAFRSLFPTNQNLAGSANRHMRKSIDSVLAIHPPLAYVSGHEHNLQVMEGDAARYLLISGAGPSERPYAVGRSSRTLFALAGSGYMRIDFLGDGRQRLAVLALDRDEGEYEVYSRWLMDADREVLR